MRLEKQRLETIKANLRRFTKKTPYAFDLSELLAHVDWIEQANFAIYDTLAEVLNRLSAAEAKAAKQADPPAGEGV